MEQQKYGYHKNIINKGVLGEVSKIQEELDELKDAEEQGNKILSLCECADLIGAIEAYLAKNHASTTLKDLKIMADATKRSFINGDRK